MKQARKSRANRLEVIAIVLLLIGVLLIPLNFFYPVTTLQNHNQPVTSLNEYSVNSMSYHNVTFSKPFMYPYDYLLNFTGAAYWYSSPLHLNQGQVFFIYWATSIDPFIGYIFSENQFNYFQSIFSSLVNSIVNSTINWSNGTAFPFEATGISGRFGDASFEATQSGNYVCVITNGELGGQNSFDACFFSGSVISAYDVTHLAKESNNLCLYLGITFLVAGTTSLLAVIVRHQKIAKSKNKPTLSLLVV